MRHITAAIVVLSFATGANAADYSKLSGQDLYKKFCASCHGADGRGNGPIAAALKQSPADLTLIASRYGQFPGKRIEEVVDGRVAVDAHGPSAMPVWGEEFARSPASDQKNPQAEKDSRDVIHKIVEYLRSLQRTK